MDERMDKAHARAHTNTLSLSKETTRARTHTHTHTHTQSMRESAGMELRGWWETDKQRKQRNNHTPSPTKVLPCPQNTERKTAHEKEREKSPEEDDEQEKQTKHSPTVSTAEAVTVQLPSSKSPKTTNRADTVHRPVAGPLRPEGHLLPSVSMLLLKEETRLTLC